jgi:UDP-GlcNAc:undecaprenyl-phosphate GlcNAc-1-phosphate transferase
VLDYLAVFAVATLGTYGLTFLVRRLAPLVGAVVAPDSRRVHDRPTPTVGGAAMFVAFLVAMGVASQLPQFKPIFQNSSEPLGIVLGGSIIFMVGLIDDLRDVSAPAKVAGQVLAASVLYFLGVTMFNFKVPFAGFIVLSPDLTPLLTVLWVVGIANAVNLIDGLDGLAAGIIAIAAGAFFVYGQRLVDLGVLSTNNMGPLIAILACGVCVGFLPHNFHRARVFMGDAGAMFLGLLMAGSTMVVGGRTPDVSGETYFFFAPLFIPFFILGVPIIDTAFAIVRRMARGSGLSTPDKDHLHHRLIRLGHGHRRSVLILWAWTAILSGFVLYPLFTRHGNAVIPFAAAGLGVALYTLFHPGVRQRGTLGDADAAGDERPPDTELASRGARPVVADDGDEADRLAEVISIDDGDRERAAQPAAHPKRRRG